MKKIVLITFAAFLGTMQLNICASATQAKGAKTPTETFNQFIQKYDNRYDNLSKKIKDEMAKMSEGENINPKQLETISSIIFAAVSKIAADIIDAIAVSYTDLKNEIEQLKQSAVKK